MGRTTGSAIAVTGLAAAPRLLEAFTGAALTAATGSTAVVATGFAEADLVAAGATAGTGLVATTGAAALTTALTAGAAFATTLGTTFDGAITFPLATGVGFATAFLLLAWTTDAGLVLDLPAALGAGTDLDFSAGFAAPTDFDFAAGLLATVDLALACTFTVVAFCGFAEVDLARATLPALTPAADFDLLGPPFATAALPLIGLAATDLTDELLLTAELLLEAVAFAAGFTKLASAAANFPTVPDFAAGFATGFVLVELAAGFELDFGFAATILPDFLRLSGRVL
ncbi:MAG: hypothetical protein ACT4NL_01435 [Pseudomarimonas sp.]